MPEIAAKIVEIQIKASPTAKKTTFSVSESPDGNAKPTDGKSSTNCIKRIAIIAIICETVLILPKIFAATTLPFEAEISRIDVTENSLNRTIITATQSQ